MTWWHSVTSQSHRIKGETTDKAFQEQCSLWERGASAGVDFDFLTLKIPAQEHTVYRTLLEKFIWTIYRGVTMSILKRELIKMGFCVTTLTQLLPVFLGRPLCLCLFFSFCFFLAFVLFGGICSYSRPDLPNGVSWTDWIKSVGIPESSLSFTAWTGGGETWVIVKHSIIVISLWIHSYLTLILIIIIMRNYR